MHKITIFALMITSFLIGFLGAKISDFTTQKRHQNAIIENEIEPEIPLIKILKRSGDLLHFEIETPAKILWNHTQFINQHSTNKVIPLGQIPTESDLKFQNFKYTGNAKTMKFYPSNSYHARGTEVRYRRYFQTREAAVTAGFKPSKLVK